MSRIKKGTKNPNFPVWYVSQNIILPTFIVHSITVYSIQNIYIYIYIQIYIYIYIYIYTYIHIVTDLKNIIDT